MAKQSAKATCPSCKQAISVDVDVPELPTVQAHLEPQHADLASTVKAAVSDALSSSKEKPAESAELMTLRQQVAEAATFATGVNRGEIHGDPVRALEHFDSCPECKEAIKGYLTKHKPEIVGNLTTDEVKALAKTHKFWPPAPLDFGPDVTLTRRART